MCDDVKITADEAICAAKPCWGVKWVNPCPMVRMMRHPPKNVPIAIATAQLTTTHAGVEEFDASVPLAMRASVTTPMVFCASLVPCAMESSDDEPICPTRKPNDEVSLSTFAVRRLAAKMATPAATKATNGARPAGMMTFEISPPQSTA